MKVLLRFITISTSLLNAKNIDFTALQEVL
jgi:hypothetical protein